MTHRPSSDAAPRPTTYELVCWVLATVFGTGYLPGNPQMQKIGYKKLRFREGKGAGLLASLFTAIAQALMLYFEVSLLAAFVAACASFAIGMIIVGPADRYIRKRTVLAGKAMFDHTRKKTDHDFNQNCWDEVVGQLFAAIPVFLYVEAYADHSFGVAVLWLLVCFALFRVFDSAKPFGIKRVEKCFGKGALSIILDDVVAALWTIVFCAAGMMFFYWGDFAFSLVLWWLISLIAIGLVMAATWPERE